MGIRLLIGNLSLDTTETDLEELFSQVGRVQSIELVIEPQTGKRKGFAFVEMSTVLESQNAIKQLDGAIILGRAITINSFQPAAESAGFFARFLRFGRA